MYYDAIIELSWAIIIIIYILFVVAKSLHTSGAGLLLTVVLLYTTFNFAALISLLALGNSYHIIYMKRVYSVFTIDNRWIYPLWCTEIFIYQLIPLNTISWASAFKDIEDPERGKKLDQISRELNSSLTINFVFLIHFQAYCFWRSWVDTLFYLI